jgi:hypothetical protein
MTDELKPGQKHPTPTPGFGDRVFYETLLRQRPDSVMAQEWYVICANFSGLEREHFTHPLLFPLGVFPMECCPMTRLKS